MNRKAESKTDRMATLACLCSLCTCLVAHAEDKLAEIDGVVYSYWINGSDANGNKQVLLGHQSPECAIEIPDDRKQITIPKTINGETIEGISERACMHLVDVEEIVLPDGITEIGRDAFRECWSLKKINIPSSVHTIGSGAFEDCESLQTITLPKNVTIIGNDVFKGCKSLESFVFPKGVCTWGSCPVNLERKENRRRGNLGVYSKGRRGGSAGRRSDEPTVHSQHDGDGLGDEFFAGCSSLKRIALPPSFNRIGYQAFYGCTSLTEIDLPPNLKKICSGAFSGCKSLKLIDLPESVVEIGYNAFNGCSHLKTIQLPYRITEIEGGDWRTGGTFGNCTSLKEISIPENVKGIGMFAFLNCTSLQKVSFSPDIQRIRIGDGAFKGCINLNEIALPRCIANSVLDAKIDNKYDSKKLRELPGLKITYLD